MAQERTVKTTPSHEIVMKGVEQAQDPIGYLVSAAEQGFLLPKHVAVILDGNGRWAERHKLQTITEGHKKGSEAITHLMRDTRRLFPYIETVTLWALSPENIKNRSQEEVSSLMHIINDMLLTIRGEVMENNGQIIHIGDKTGLTDYLQKTFTETENMTKNNTGQKIVLAVNFNGEQDSLRLANEAIQYTRRSGKDAIDQQILQQLRDPQRIGPAQMIIRTGTELSDGQSLSGFGIDRAGTQLIFTPTLLPDFTTREFATCIAQYRTRRMGGRPGK